MTLDDVFTSLANGILSNLAVGGDNSGVIPSQHYGKVCSAVNGSLLALYGRFLLHEREVAILAHDGILTYPLKRIHAVTDTTPGVLKFIVDTAEDPFTEDVIKILTIFDEDGGEMGLNNEEDPDTLYSPTPTTLQIMQPVTGDVYFVNYQAKHPKLTPSNLSQEILLPEILMAALEAHVAYQIMSPMNGQEHAAKASEHLSRYEMLCAEVVDKDLVGTSLGNDTSYKFELRGFA